MVFVPGGAASAAGNDRLILLWDTVTLYLFCCNTSSFLTIVFAVTYRTAGGGIFIFSLSHFCSFGNDQNNFGGKQTLNIQLYIITQSLSESALLCGRFVGQIGRTMQVSRQILNKNFFE